MRLLCGPAGTGKTFRCLSEIRQLLCASPEGLTLLFVSPKQTTALLERQLLEDPDLAGYTRLQILSFERLAHLVFDWLGLTPPELLDEQGRLMVLRAIVAKKLQSLKIFRASARLGGFVQHLSGALRKIQNENLTPDSLRRLAKETRDVSGLSEKLEDLAVLLEAYMTWLDSRHLQDTDSLLSVAIEALRKASREKGSPFGQKAQLDLFAGQRVTSTFSFDRLWVDGFAQFSQQETALLAALMPFGREGTITFCMDRSAGEENSWLSSDRLIYKTYQECRKTLGDVPGLDIVTEMLPRNPKQNRFGRNVVLQHLERYWDSPNRMEKVAGKELPPPVGNTIQISTCSNPDAEATIAAREILRHVRAGGRFREVSVLMRSLKGYQEAFHRVFSKYQIPFFMDRREPVSHHPLPELTRNALRTIVFGWQHEDWFAALKTGLVPCVEGEIDRLENEALARGWSGAIWQRPIIIADNPELTQWLAGWHQRVFPAFQQLAVDLGGPLALLNGSHLFRALRQFWKTLNVEKRLQDWSDAEPDGNRHEIKGLIHATVWQGMNKLLENVELAFSNESLVLSDWLPILEAGLGSLTVGVIPPELDEVLVGAIDRSRNPEIKLAIVVGLNESVFPAPPESGLLLSDEDQLALEKQGISLNLPARLQLSRERFLGYIAFTRASERLVLTCSKEDANGSPLNPSPFFKQLTTLFPGLQIQNNSEKPDWRDCVHSTEVVAELLRLRFQSGSKEGWPPQLEKIPGLLGVPERLEQFDDVRAETRLDSALAERLFGPKLRTSVSRLEQFAACPFKFFVHSGLRAEERKRFELDVKEQGSFLHDVLALFHGVLQRQNKRWRDITPGDARELIVQIAAGLAATYRDGLLTASDRSRFIVRVMTSSLQDFIGTLVDWMRQQYQFDPVAVELSFGDDQNAKPWEIDLGGGRRLALQGRIDRVDLFRQDEQEAAQCIVVDYKSGQRRLDPVLLAHGLQLQLVAYLAVVRRWPDPVEQFGVKTLVPAGVFYVSLRGQYPAEPTRTGALADTDTARKLAYRHSGRFNAQALPLLDNRTNVRKGDQFNYRLTMNGQLHRNCAEALPNVAFERLLDSIESRLKDMGQKIFAGEVQVAPYRHGVVTACSQCDYSGICRIDPWTHRYRVLKRD